VRARGVEIPRPGKLLIPPATTKAELAAYYGAVAEPMLRHCARRPLSLERYPDGIGARRIFQQHAARHFPAWIARVEVPAGGGTVEHVMARDPDTLVYLAGQAVVTFHAWLSRADRLERPDRLVIDLDPPDARSGEVRRAAVLIGRLLRELGLEPWAMASGSRGYHVVLPLQRRLDFEVVRSFARGVAELAEAREPRLFTTEQRRARRAGRIYLDVLRNSYGHTSVAPYSVRARPHAPVATPLHWEELEDQATRPDRWTLASVPGRVARDGDPWESIGRAASSLSRARRRLEASLEEARSRPTRRGSGGGRRAGSGGRERR
jgi:bifunctional non-homologous end joining protein LigD